MRDRLMTRLAGVLVLLLLSMGLSACYKNAGENVEPTSNRVDLSDIATNTPPGVQATSTPNTSILPTKPSGSPSPTRVTLAPTITPAGATSESELGPTPTSGGGLAPTFTPVTGEPVEPLFTTPGMSDIQASATATQTVDPALQPTPTGIPVEENPCIHVVAGGDTLYSIAQTYEVGVSDIVAVNPLLGGSELTPLQIGWQLTLPGCGTPTPAATTAPPAGATPGVETPVPGGQTTYVVQAGDTVFSIANTFGVTVDAIVAANNLSKSGDVVFISVGQTLIIPPAQ